MTKTLHVTSRSEWRAWLEEHNDKETEVWLFYYKAHTGKPRVPYEDAVEEALCFGWIDSIVRRLDDESYAQKFTPRRSTSTWSASNRRRLVKLIGEGRMTPAGLAKVGDPAAAGPGQGDRDGTDRRPDPVLPPPMRRALMANEKAWAFFNRLAPSYRRTYIRWVMSAKRPETRDRRLQELADTLAQDRKLGLK
jgi:uncharacterized protein YdeI (YjbR/CyaY-like superfamily)